MPGAEARDDAVAAGLHHGAREATDASAASPGEPTPAGEAVGRVEYHDIAIVATC